MDQHSPPAGGTDRPRLAYSEARSRSDAALDLDRSLLLRLADDDGVALDELVRRKTRPLVHLAQRILGDGEEARDVVQLAFLRVWSHRRRYDQRFSPNTWLYRITTNLAIDHLRARRSREQALRPFGQVALARAQGQAERGGGILRQDIERLFAALMPLLAEKQRAAFILRELEGLSSSEVAEILGCRESTVRNHVFNARLVLQRALRERFPEYARRFAAPEGGS